MPQHTIQYILQLAYVVFAGTMVPHRCPDGTYTLPEQGGLQGQRECLP